MEVQLSWRKHIIWGWFIGSPHFQVSFSASHVMKCDQLALGICHHGICLLPCCHTTMDSCPSRTTSQVKLFLLCIVLGHGAYQSLRKVTSAEEYWFWTSLEQLLERRDDSSGPSNILFLNLRAGFFGGGIFFTLMISFSEHMMHTNLKAYSKCSHACHVSSCMSAGDTKTKPHHVSILRCSTDQVQP